MTIQLILDKYYTVTVLFFFFEFNQNQKEKSFISSIWKEPFQMFTN